MVGNINFVIFAVFGGVKPRLGLHLNATQQKTTRRAL